HTIFALDPMTPVNNIMNGLPRACLPSGLNIYQWIIFLFPNFYGFLINFLIIHIIGFIGMFIFLRNHILKLSEQKPLALLVAVAFCILPVYTIAGIAVLGVPLVLNALLYIQKGEGKLKHYLALFLYAIYSFYSMFPMIIVGAGLFFLYNLIRHRKWNWKLFWAASFLCACVVISEYQILYTFIFHKIIPHRLVEHFLTSLNYKGVFVATLIVLGNGIISSANYPVYLVGLSLIIIIVCYIIYKPEISLPVKLFLLAFGVSLVVAIWDWYQLQFLYDKYPFFSTFSFKRVNFFLPFIVYTLLAASLALADQKFRWLKYVLVPLILFSTLKMNYSFNHSEGSDSGKLTYRQFFSEKLFKDMNTYIGKPQESYRVCDVGLLPSVSQYNGFFTLDSYQYLIPMSYREQFIKIVQGELNKSKGLTTFFSSPRGGPNVCFTFSAEEYDAKVLGNKITEINNLDLNYDALKAMGCQYIFSIYPVRKFTSDKIVFQKEFINTEAPFNIYLYKVI
ncbi:MAG TPA: DUF6044 family protein, partial [Bacteroidia bacterium]|nr:DUF6044 family protein [Bacteroidia bacterium]